MTGSTLVVEAGHGTYSGYQRHGRQRETACDPCRAAATAYHKAQRAAHPERYAKQKRDALANQRALWRLANLHPAQFRALAEEERLKARQAAS